MKNATTSGLACKHWAIAALFMTSLLCAQPKGSQVYRNQRFNYCFEFPETWLSSESLTRNGVTLAPKDGTKYSASPTITVGARSDQPSEQNDKRLQDLEELFQTGLAGLQQYANARDVEVIKKTPAVMSGHPAIDSTIRYTDGNSSARWILRKTITLDDNQIEYFVELKSYPRDADSLSSIFEHTVQSFKIKCEKAD